MLTTLFVVARIVANPVSNVFQKQLAQRGSSAVFIIAATHAILTLAIMPLLVRAPWSELSTAFWASMGICTVLAVASNVLLVSALQRSDLSVLGPINAYKSVVSLGLGVVLLGEIPTMFGVAGVVLILWGSYFVIERDSSRPRGGVFLSFFLDRGIQFRLAALVLSATEAVFLKRAILHASPAITFIFWSSLGLLVAAAAAAFLPRGAIGAEVRRFGANWGTFLWLALMTGVMQAATLFTFGELQVGYSLALFQLSTLISVFLGYRYFEERNIRRRLIGSLIMVAGALLIVLFGRPREGAVVSTTQDEAAPASRGHAETRGSFISTLAQERVLA